VIIIYEDYGGGHQVGGGGQRSHLDFFKSFTLEYENGSIGGRERKQRCL